MAIENGPLSPRIIKDSYTAHSHLFEVTTDGRQIGGILADLSLEPDYIESTTIALTAQPPNHAKLRQVETVQHDVVLDVLDYWIEYVETLNDAEGLIMASREMQDSLLVQLGERARHVSLDIYKAKTAKLWAAILPFLTILATKYSYDTTSPEWANVAAVGIVSVGAIGILLLLARSLYFEEQLETKIEHVRKSNKYKSGENNLIELKKKSVAEE